MMQHCKPTENKIINVDINGQFLGEPEYWGNDAIWFDQDVCALNEDGLCSAINLNFQNITLFGYATFDVVSLLPGLP